MTEYILACTCSGVPEKAVTSFKIMFPGLEVPEVTKGKTNILTLSSRNPDTNLGKYLHAIAKQNGQYAYYIKADDDGNIVENYNLLTGSRLA